MKCNTLLDIASDSPFLFMCLLNKMLDLQRYSSIIESITKIRNNFIQLYCIGFLQPKETVFCGPGDVSGNLNKSSNFS